MKKLAIYLAVFALAAVGSGMAEAHTTSIGFVSAGTPGSVTFYTGTYHSTTANEAGLTLVGILGTTYASTTLPFTGGTTSTKPIGLVDGVSNFYWNFSGVLDPALTSDPGFAGGVRTWQGVTFAGLAAGDYAFSCGGGCGNTFRWTSVGSGAGTLTLTGAVVGAPVPEPGTIVLMATGLIGLAAWGRKKKLAQNS